MILVDTSVWIAAAKPTNPECLTLRRHLRKNDVLTTKIVQVEVCQGARTQQQFDLLWDSFLGLKFLPITDETWLKSAINYFRCRKKGLTISTVDCLLATLAQTRVVPLWTLDKQLMRARAILGIDVFHS